MKSTIVLMLFLIMPILNIYGQQTNLQLHDRKFSAEIEQAKADGSLSSSQVAYYYTYIGKYKKALEQYEVPLEWNLSTVMDQDSLEFLNYKPVNAENYLRQRLKNEEVVIISEAHHKPQHRIFTLQLLDELYDNGFRYLGLETLMPSFNDSSHYLMDTMLMERGYPLNSPFTGYYTREPQMANLLRTALGMGFTVFGYEKLGGELERDMAQAMNINKFMKAHPKGKIVIHCGWYHAIESDFPKRKDDRYMAYHLKQLTGIDPLTIYQDVFTEKRMEGESPYYDMIESNEVSVLLNEQGAVFGGFSGHQHVDILLYHPATNYLKNREEWLYSQPGMQFVEIDRSYIRVNDYPVIVEAIPDGEQYSVGVDIIELDDEKDMTALVLTKGHYLIKITDRNHIEKSYSIEVR